MVRFGIGCGATPWSARDAPLPAAGTTISASCKCEQADGGVGRRPGGLPHNLCRCAVVGKLSGIAHSCVPRRHSCRRSVPAECPYAIRVSRRISGSGLFRPTAQLALSHSPLPSLFRVVPLPSSEGTLGIPDRKSVV